MIILYTIIFILSVLGIISALFLLYRNKRTYEIRSKINSMCRAYGIRHSADIDFVSPYETIWPKLPSYETMVYSFKPLKIEAWLSEEDINELNR